MDIKYMTGKSKENTWVLKLCIKKNSHAEQWV